MEGPTELEGDIITKIESPTEGNSSKVKIENFVTHNESIESKEHDSGVELIMSDPVISNTKPIVDFATITTVKADAGTGDNFQDLPVETISFNRPQDSHSVCDTKTEIEDMYKFPKIRRLALPSDSSDVSLITEENNFNLDFDNDQSKSTLKYQDNSLTEDSVTCSDLKFADTAELSKKFEDNSINNPDEGCDVDKAENDPKIEDCSPVKEEPPAASAVSYYWDYIFDSSRSPTFLASTNKIEEFPSSQFLKGCKWAPDGSCLLTNSDDSTLRLFNFPTNVSHIQDWDNIDTDTVQTDDSWRSVLQIKEGGCVYDYCWYPFASSLDPATTCFLSTSKDTPVHLWDATYGNLRATYLAYNDVDEPTAAYSVAFDPTGEHIYCGYEKAIRIFTISRPGRNCTLRKLTGNLLPDLNQQGLISSIAFNPSWSNVYACGSYRKKIGLYMEDGTVIHMLEGHTGGVTNLIFSRDGTKLYSGARSDSKLICWDLRNMGSEYKVYDRVVKTQQRIYFELTTNDRYLISGSTDGVLRIWDTLEEDKEAILFPPNTDCINGVSINPIIPVLATTSGQRQCYDMSEDSNSDSDDDIYLRAKSKYKHSCDVKLWKY